MGKSTIYHMKTPPGYQAGSGTPPTYKELGLGYVATGTTHGVPHIYLARGRCKSIFWVLCFLLGATALLVNLTFLVTKYIQFLPSTRIVIQQNRTLTFPAVTICNTNPIKGSAVGHSPRLVALLESWGVIQTSGNTTRRKRGVQYETDAELYSVSEIPQGFHHISKRSADDECSFIKAYNARDGLVSACLPNVELTNTDEAGCLQEACNRTHDDLGAYNVINFVENVSCSIRVCELPLNDTTLMLTADSDGSDIFVRAYNECLSAPCVHGDCSDTDLYYSCTCHAGYTGLNCDTDIDECESEPCQNGGTCQDLVNRYNCTCEEGYKALDCSLVTDGYHPFEDTLCSGPDLLPSVNLTVAECGDLCDDTIGCIAFSYVPATEACTIKGQCSTMDTMENTTAYVKYTPSVGYSVYLHSDCSGNDIKSSTTRTSAWDCHRECDEVVPCVAFVFIESLSKCHIKSACDVSSLTSKDTSGGYGVYLKTGRAGSCSVPRARIPCPGSYENITEKQCNALPASCCFENTQADVAWCYWDTLDGVHHNHIHTVFRAAQNVPSSPVLYDLWVGDSVSPDLESEVTTNHFSTEDSETEVYKSAIAKCSWWRVRMIYTTVHSDAEETVYFQFSPNNNDKSSWYTDGQLKRSFYSDASSSTTYETFSIEGDTFDSVRRRWYINSQLGGCTYDTGWFVVLDADHTGSCPWDTQSDLPLFMYSGLTTKSAAFGFLTGETFFTKVELDDYSLGGFCISSCLYMSDGAYQSCVACNIYVICTGQVMTYHVCHKAQSYDAYHRTCVDSSYTCSGGKVSDSCIPINECDTNQQCLNGGTCSMATQGWECLCVDGYTGRYCHNCADTTSGTDLQGSSQTVLSWTTSDEGTVYADGVELDASSDWSEVIESHVPCGTLLVAFVLDTSASDRGLLASYGDTWSTGDADIKCTSDAGVVSSPNWKLYEYDDSAWQVPSIMGTHGDSPWGTLSHIRSDAKWVWTNDGASQIYCRLYMCTDTEEMLLLADDTVEVFADAISLKSLTFGSGATTIQIPCNTNQMAFKVTKGSSSKGLLVKYGSVWVTGDLESLLCSSDASLGSSELWTYMGYDRSGWQPPSVVSHTTAPPPDFGSGQWVWTDDDASTIYCVNKLVEPTTTTVTTVTTTEPTTTEAVTTTSFTFHSSYAERNENPPTEDFLREEDIMTLMADLDEDTKRKLGYSLNDLVTECHFGGQPCTESDFSWFFDAVYGNCYVFNSHWEEDENATQFEPSQQGYHHGLTVVMDIGQYEYIPDVGEAAGAVVVVHDPDVMPFPEDEGIQAVPGKLTSVGIKKVEIQRLPEPHGDCVKNMDRNQSRSLFEDLYPVKYSVSTCFKTCYQKYVVERCGCGDPQYPIEGRVFEGQEVTPCNARDITQDDCKYGVTKQYINDELDCDCRNPCEASSYEYKVSSSDWPPCVNEAEIFANFRTKLAGDGVTGLSDAQLKSNLVKIQVFYETLSHETLSEYPSYRLAKLFWDIGGILGLFLGCSVLSIVEVMELGLDALILLCYKVTKKKYWAMPVQGQNGSNKVGDFDDISKDNLGGRKTDKKVKLSKDGMPLYSYSGQTGKGLNSRNGKSTEPQKMSLPGYLLTGSDIY